MRKKKLQREIESLKGRVWDLEYKNKCSSDFRSALLLSVLLVSLLVNVFSFVCLATL